MNARTELSLLRLFRCWLLLAVAMKIVFFHPNPLFAFLASFAFIHFRRKILFFIHYRLHRGAHIRTDKSVFWGRSREWHIHANQLSPNFHWNRYVDCCLYGNLNLSKPSDFLVIKIIIVHFFLLLRAIKECPLLLIIIIIWQALIENTNKKPVPSKKLCVLW